MAVCLSTYTLSMIALDRYILIVHPTRRAITRRQAIGLIIIVWTAALMIASPIGIHITVVSFGM